ARGTITVQPEMQGSTTTEPDILDKISAGHRVILTEFDPPKNLDLDKYIAGARALADAGSDALTLADNSLAILRMSNIAVGILLKEMGIQTILHMSCRDRNILGLQSDLLGMAAHGIRHVLPLTGDPAKVGDHPGASSVYDVSSIDLIKIIRQMNEGFSHSGNALKKRPEFVIGCTFNPNAKNLEAQIARLKRKLEAGAKYVMTQPIFDTALAQKTAEALRDISVPVFIGVWPLLSGKQAHFLHHEVPGITIPDSVQTAMANLEGAAGVAAGLGIAEEVSRAVLDHFPGIYLITPFLRFEVTAQLAAYARQYGK
ncbi:MAG: methylenetetrahydrofolate reductase, partial [Chthoniobacterales bacterium]